MTTHTTSTDQCWHHAETIKCPKCGLIQDARVQHTSPVWAYDHECSCGYWITESEWDTVPNAGAHGRRGSAYAPPDCWQF